MRIGIDASNLRSGGGMTHISELLKHCEPQTHGIEQITVWAHPSVVHRLPVKPWLDVVSPPALAKGLLRRIAWQLFERSALAARSCDIVFAPGGTPAGTFRPFVSMSTNMLPFSPKELRRYGWTIDRVRMQLLRHQQAKSFRDASAVIFLTDFARRSITEAAGISSDKRLAVIPGGVNHRFMAHPRAARPLHAYSDQEPFRFLYVSDVLPYKHHANVVQAVAALRAEGLPVALDIIGHPMNARASGSLRDAIRTVSCPAVRYLGPADHDSLPPVYRAADAFVFASTCENLPMTLVEAMGSGLPIAASASGPMPEILGAAAAFFDAEQTSSIADALRHIASDADLRDACAQTAHRKAAEYSWTDCAARTLQLLVDVAQEARARRPAGVEVRVPAAVVRTSSGSRDRRTPAH